MSLQFSDLSLNRHLLSAVAGEGYRTATPIQARAIPLVLQGRDVLGCAQTGTGKTAAFALPMLQLLSTDGQPQSRRRPIRGLVLAPTRELASQIADSLKVYGRNLSLRHVVIFGGVGQNPQVAALKSGVDVVVATPGRLMDLMAQGHVDLSHVEMFVLDEADRMLDMGFIPDIRRIAAKLPGERQTLLFSATMPPTILSLARSLLKNPERVDVAPETATADRIEQLVYHVEKASKPALLSHLVKRDDVDRAIVFTRTKHGADRVVKQLERFGLPAAAIHGNKSQNNRQRALEGFRSGRVRLLIATDVAARGIDVDGITHVFNYDVSHEPETYVHRIGRTARAGASGIAITFCDRDERSNLRAVERLIRMQITVRTDQPEHLAKISPQESSAPAAAGSPAGRKTRGGQGRATAAPAKPARRTVSFHLGVGPADRRAAPGRGAGTAGKRKGIRGRGRKTLARSR